VELIIRLYQKQRFETDKTPEQVWELLQSSNQSIEQELRKSFLSRMGGFKGRCPDRSWRFVGYSLGS